LIYLQYRLVYTRPAMTKHKPIIACLCVALLLPAWDVATAERNTAELREIVESLGEAVETLAAETRPLEWPRLHSCLYYALAGQHLLAGEGIPSRLVLGTVVYGPYITGQHGINPHIWLETATHLIDYATLPRWGEVSVIPLSLVARSTREVTPGLTRIAVLPRPGSLQERRFITMHRSRFERALARRR